VIRLLLLALVAGIGVYLVQRWRRDRREEALARARSVFFIVGRGRADTNRPSTGMRTVTAGGGLLRIRVPESWVDEPAGGGFCARASNSRRFRVEVRTLEHPGASPETVAENLRNSPEGLEGLVEALSGDRVLLKHVRDGAEDAAVGLTYCWRLATPRPPDRVLVAEFSFSVSLMAADAITEDDLDLLEREIREAVFSDPT
jgi:hypothetical protein